MWGLHDFCLEGAQGGSSFREQIEKSYGGADNVADWVHARPVRELRGLSRHVRGAEQEPHGPADLDEPSHLAVVRVADLRLLLRADRRRTSAARKASEPLHIQWNPVSESIEVVNYSGGDARGLTARVEVLNMDGEREVGEDGLSGQPGGQRPTPASRWSTRPGLTPVHFLRLKLTRGDEIVSENFYWRGTEEGNYRAIRELPKVKLEAATRVERQGRRWRLTTELHNLSKQPGADGAVEGGAGEERRPHPARALQRQLCRLMPGERRTIRLELENADTRGEKPRIVVEGFNTQEAKEE